MYILEHATTFDAPPDTKFKRHADAKGRRCIIYPFSPVNESTDEWALLISSENSHGAS